MKMRRPKLDGRTYDCILGLGDIWYIVFPNYKARETYHGFKDLPVSSLYGFLNAYKTDTDYVRNIGHMTPIVTRHRDSNPRAGDSIMLDGDDIVRGKIVFVRWSHELAIAKFDDGSRRDFEWRELEGQWTDRFGGTYIIEGDDAC